MKSKRQIILTEYDKQRFASKIEITASCWNWIAGKISTGYGELKINGMDLLAHRVSYEIHKGKIPDGLELDHLCRNRICVNPNHLEAVTHKQNNVRGMVGLKTGLKQKSKTHCPLGHPYSGDNLYINNKTYKRACKKCHCISQKEYLKRRRL